MLSIHCQVLQSDVGSQRFALQMENEGRRSCVAVGHFRGFERAARWIKYLMCLPSRVRLVQDVLGGGIHVAQKKFAVRGGKGNQEPVLLRKKERDDTHVFELPGGVSASDVEQVDPISMARREQ